MEAAIKAKRVRSWKVFMVNYLIATRLCMYGQLMMPDGKSTGIGTEGSTCDVWPDPQSILSFCRDPISATSGFIVKNMLF
jgi:hypothetical protein